MHRRDHAVPCRRCRRATFQPEPLCDLCVAACTASEECAYYQFDLDSQRVEIPEFRRSREDVLAELINALA